MPTLTEIKETEYDVYLSGEGECPFKRSDVFRDKVSHGGITHVYTGCVFVPVVIREELSPNRNWEVYFCIYRRMAE